MRLGMIGLSPGNGHPFSFSAIINGYHEARFATAGWPMIQDYLRRCDPGEFGFPGVSVTHAWTQDDTVTRTLCHACVIEHAVAQPEDMIGAVDAVLLARDDAESHWPIARPLLDAGLPVYIDKPLTLRWKELEAFWPYLRSGRVMSCSGLRFAPELDEFRSDSARLGRLRLVRGAILHDWEKYGIHLLDAALRTTSLIPVSVRRLPAGHDSLFIETADGAPIQIDALGDVAKMFHLEFIGTTGRFGADLLDHFTAFRRTLEAFITMVRTGQPVVPASDTWRTISTIIAGSEALPGAQAVRVPAPPTE